ncbi:MAG: hypothetical protein HYW57_05720 [Ignavibacteriales bacterium]|nr:hypothetical protein [Ignavibacteriales bacterium]
MLFSLILLLIPPFFFLLLETGLRLFRYGTSTEQWIHATNDKLILNHDIGKRYFHSVQNIPISIQDVFDEHKKPGTFRVFVLGESSGAGYPYTPIGSFSRWLKKRLDILYPGCTIEVVNLSMTAVNTHTLRDLFPGVLEQQPDLVLVYAGHNEYYGALGVGSTETLGSNSALIRLSLLLSRFKTTQLVRTAIQTISQWLADGAAPQDGTLMSRMAKDQYIPLDSEKFAQGLSQYEGNMRSILEMAADRHIPVILGTLTNNLKDHPPFISIATEHYPAANDVFQDAHGELATKNYPAADSLFRLAKDLDVLRFRSSEKMNTLIRRLGHEYRCPVVPVDSAFNALSPGGIVGNNLMTDHLHPTLEGYELMARLYFDAMQRNKLLPPCVPRNLASAELNRLTRESFPFTRLDSVIAQYRITILKNDWPYIEKRNKKILSELIKPADFVESTALEFLEKNETWEAVQKKLAGWYLSNKDYVHFQRQMDVLISQYPIVVEYYDFVANELLKVQMYDEAFSILERRKAIKTGAYPSKWLGIINLSRGETNEAVALLEESLKYDPADTQVLYNLSGAYSYARQYQKALDAINACLAIDSTYPKAAGLRQQIEHVLTSK